MPDLSEIPNEMILASAGSGKTYQLTNRYIALMALSHQAGLPVHPERIIAVTFTRKAAGEFFDAILVKLAEAASDPEAAAKLAGDGRDPLSSILATLAPEDFRALLRIFIQRMPRLFLGTLDSFFSNILRSFPAEFGLTGDFEVMDEYRAASAIDRVYASVFRRRLGGDAEEDRRQQAFLEAFRLATFGKEESNVIRSLDRFVEELHPLYLGAPDAKYWGQADVVWRDGCRWLVDDIDPAAEFERLAPLLADAPARVVQFWDEFREEVAEHEAGLPFGSRTKNYMLPRFLTAWGDLENGHAAIKFDRTVLEFGAMHCEAVRRVVQWLVGGEIRARLRRTRGVWELLHRYEQTYADRVRRLGQLTFQDIQLLLAGQESGDQPAPLLSQAPGELDRLRIDYRLDARYDHWLLDEFQDTNFLQWKVIANLVDEVVQDTSGARSLFQVGDVKQAIYAWRGGDTRLFTDIFEHYNAHEQRIHPRRLFVSWRSSPDVLDPVNRVFGDPEALRALDLPEETVNRWDWDDHESAGKLADQPGCTEFLNPRPSDGESKPDDEDIAELVRGILEEVRPTERGLSCAILVRSNRRGDELVDHLRSTSPDIPVASEAEQHIATDNPVNLALVSLFQLAAHPGDTFAWEHLLLTPYREVIEENDWSPGRLARHIASSLLETNFEAVVSRFVSQLEAAIGSPFDRFTRDRVDGFALAARLYDETGGRDIDDFLAYARRHTVREVVDESAVQVMTYHKSKGLTFDMVILPDLKSNSLTSVRFDIAAHTNQEREIEWVLDMPGRDIVAADPVLGEFLAEKEAEAAYESLCLYYVGMTRARYANYLVAPPQGSRSTSKNFVRLLQDTLAGEPEPVTFSDITADRLYQSDTETTDPRWFESFSLDVREEPEPVDAAADTEPPARRPRPSRRTPSGSEEAVVTAAQVFDPGSNVAREFGNAVHALFERVEWATPDTEIPAPPEGEFDPEIARQAHEQARTCLADPSVIALLARPDSPCELWREKSFEILIEGEWLSGTFDRVVIERDEDGAAVRARIVDFKTDRIATSEDAEAGSATASRHSLEAAVSKYRPQLDTYRAVLARLLGLPTERIETALLFTRIPEVVTIPETPRP